MEEPRDGMELGHSMETDHQSHGVAQSDRGNVAQDVPLTQNFVAKDGYTTGRDAGW